MTDKLAEAIANMYATFDWHGGLDDRAKVLEAARAYHALPVVDFEGLERDCATEIHINSPYAEGYIPGWNACLGYIKSMYPNGLVWKEEWE